MSKAWFITGGSSGIGLSLGRHVLRNGSHAVLTTRNVDSARSSAPDIEERGGKWLQLDLSAANLESLVEDAVEREGIDTVVNNAGYAQVSPVENCK